MRLLLPVAFACFVVIEALVLTAASSSASALHREAPGDELPDVRPPPVQRTFTSDAVEHAITNISANIASPQLARLFANALPNTLDTTVRHFDESKPDTFIITGDIDAMWIRDAANQVWPYLHFINDDARLDRLLLGVVARMSKQIKLDAYANAFQPNATCAPSQHAGDRRTPPMQRGVFEGKFELDSLAHFLRLSAAYVRFSSNKAEAAQRVINLPDWNDALEALLGVLDEQSKSSDEQEQEPSPAYGFARVTDTALDTLAIAANCTGSKGLGETTPGTRTGLVRSHFRPSDDASTFPFPVAANIMTSCELSNVATYILRPTGALDVAKRCDAFSAAIALGVLNWGATSVDEAGELTFAYEIDGYGSRLLMDDANVPSLLALPLYWHADGGSFRSIYDVTRRRILSSANPFYACSTTGRRLCGVGSPHVGRRWIWPLSLVVQGWTAVASRNATEICEVLDALVLSSAGTGLLHESFDPNDPAHFTRSWFAMVNSLFGDLIVKTSREMPDVLAHPDVACNKEKIF
ncbi:metal-independent alpha-mannosidase [Pseudoscourfieldia marina]